MHARIKALAPYAAALVLSLAVGGAAMYYLQREVPVRGGTIGCAKLGAEEKRVECIADIVRDRLTASRSHGRSLDASLQRIEQDAATDVNLRSYCHQAMHIIGRAAGRHQADHGGRLTFPDRSNQLCIAGYAHGLAEGYMEAAPPGNVDLAQVFAVACIDLSASADCAHGLGHALLRRGATPSEAAAACMALKGEYRYDCSNGVFMERAMQSPPIAADQYVKDCRAQDSFRLQYSCATYIAASAITNELSERKTIAACEDAGQLRLIQACVESFGRNLGHDRAQHCSKTPLNTWGACLQGAIQLALDSDLLTAAKQQKLCAKLTPPALGKMCAAIKPSGATGRPSSS
jgi:hypothetical protein